MQEGQVGRRASRTKFIVLIALIVVAVIGGMVYKQYHNNVAHSPQTYGNAFMAAAVKKDGATSYDMFTDTAKKSISSDDWNTWVVMTFNNYNGGTPKVVKKETVPDPRHQYSKDNDSVTRLRYQVVVSGKTYTLDIIMVPTGDSWKVGAIGGLQ